MELLKDTRDNAFWSWETRVGRGTDFGDGYGTRYPFMDTYGYSEGLYHSSGKSRGSGKGYGEGRGTAKGSGYTTGGLGSSLCIRIKRLGKSNVIYIEGIPTIIDRTHGLFFKGRIVNERNFSTTPCYIARSGCYCAHGDTPLEAVKNLKNKLNKIKGE